MKKRDDLIDFMRGLCIVFMVLLHTKYMQPRLLQSIVELLNFVAGGFVFLSGVMAGHMSLERYMRDPRGVSLRMVQRAAELYGIQIIIMISVGLIFYPGAQSIRDLIVDAILIRHPKGMVDILPMFIGFFAIAPAMLWLLSRGKPGAGVLILLSAAAFFLGQRNPQIISPWGPTTFPVILWQSFFVAGVFFGRWHKPVAESFHGQRPGAWIPATLSVFVFAALAAMRFGFAGHSLENLFCKFPLSAMWFCYEIALILTVFWATAQLYRNVCQTLPYRWTAMIGRHSLNLFLLHIYLVNAALPIAQHAPVSMKLPACASLITIIFALLITAGKIFDMRGKKHAKNG
jgi:hypothetical protein